MMISYTEWNDRLKNIFKKGFRALYSTLDVERLIDELLDQLVNPKNHRRNRKSEIVIPDRFDILVNNSTYNKEFRGDQEKIEKLQKNLEKELLAEVRRRKFNIVNPKITVEIIASSQLGIKDIKILSRISENDELMTAFKRPKYQLTLIKAEVTHLPWIVEPGNSYLIGRSAEKSDITVNQGVVSKVHALLEITTTGQIYLLDKGSTNKTYINQETDPIVRKTKLHPGDYIRLGTLDPVVLKIEKH